MMNIMARLNFSKFLFSVHLPVLLIVASFSLQFPVIYVQFQSPQQDYTETATLGRGIISEASWRPDGQAILVNTNRGAWIYTADFEVLTHLDDVRLAVFSPGGSFLAAARADQPQVLVWDAESYALIQTIEISSELYGIDAIAWSADDSQIAIGIYDRVEIFDVESQQSVLSLSLATPIASLTWKLDGQRLAIGRVGYLDIVDLPQGQIHATLEIDSGKPIALWSPDHQTLATLAAYFDGAGDIINTLKVWEDDGQYLRLVIQMPYARTFAWSPDGMILASQNYSDSGYPIYPLYFWDARTGAILPLALPDSPYRQPILSAAWSPDGTHLMTALRDNTVRLYDRTLVEDQVPRTLPGHSGAVTAIAWSPDGRQLASASQDSGVRIWEVASQEQVARFQPSASEALAVAWSPDGDQLAVGTNLSTSIVFDVASGEEWTSFMGHGTQLWDSGVISLAWSPDGRFLASGGNDATVLIRDAHTFDVVNTFEEDGEFITSLDWNSDSSRLAYTSGQAGKVWTVNQDTLSFTCRESGVITALALSPDGHFVVGTNSNYGVCIWNVDENRILTQLNAYAIKLDWSPDGTKIAAIVANSETSERTLQIWDAASLEPLSVIDPGTELVAIAWSPDSRYIAAGDREGILHIWEQD
jgi:WD40 repeat protein